MEESRIDKLERYGKFAIPYIVLRDELNTPHFKVNEETKVIECIAKKLCSVCGESLNDDMWLIGGPKSAFHEHGCYIDIPVHKECAVYSLKTCPYMAYTQYIAKPGVPEKLNDKFPHLKFINPTIDQTRLEYFVLIKIENYIVKYKSNKERFIYPFKPYLEIEFWKDGERLLDNKLYDSIPKNCITK